MPQFDQSSFLNQVFWFFLCFLSFYFLCSLFILPLLSKNLKFRRKKLLKNENNINNIFFEKSKKLLNFSQFYFTFYNNLH